MSTPSRKTSTITRINIHLTFYQTLLSSLSYHYLRPIEPQFRFVIREARRSISAGLRLIFVLGRRRRSSLLLLVH